MKSPPKSKAASAGKARVMYASPELGNSKQQWFTVSSKWDDKIFCDFTRPVAVLPLSPEADAERVELAMRAISKHAVASIHYRFDNKAETWAQYRVRVKQLEQQQARQVLSAIGALSTGPAANPAKRKEGE